GGIYSWIGELQRQREDDEARRLLYVAATRARKELHLLGTAVISKNGEELSPGSSRSLLGIAWPALKDDFERALAAEPPTIPAPQQGVFDFPPASPSIRLRRLPVEWKPEEDPAAAEPEEEAPQAPERPRGSLATRAFGTAVHALLEDLAHLPGIDADSIPQ